MLNIASAAEPANWFARHRQRQLSSGQTKFIKKRLNTATEEENSRHGRTQCRTFLFRQKTTV